MTKDCIFFRSAIHSIFIKSRQMEKPKNEFVNHQETSSSVETILKFVSHSSHKILAIIDF